MKTKTLIAFCVFCALAAGCGRMGDPLPPGEARVGTPEGLVARGREEGLTLAWSLPTRTLAGAGGEISGFVVERAEVEKGKEECATCGGEFCEAAFVASSEGGALYRWTDKEANPAATYRYRVLAIDGRQNPGAPSLPVTATYYRVAPPKIEATPVDGGTLVTYDMPDPMTAFEGVTVYGEADRLLAVLDAGKEQGRVTGLKNGEPATLYFRSSVISPQGWRIESEAVKISLTPGDTEPPLPPAELALFGEPEGVRLMWMAPRGEPYKTVFIFRGDSAASLEKIASVAGDTASYVDTSATPGVTYYYGCTGADEAGNESALSAVRAASAGKK